VTPEHSTD